MISNINNKKNKIIILVLLTILLILAGVIIFILSTSKNTGKIETQTNGGKSDIMYSVIGEVTEVLREEVNVLNSIKHKTVGYRMKVRVPLSEDFAVGDEVEIHSVYENLNTGNNSKADLVDGDIIIVSYFKLFKKTDGTKIIEDGTITYGSTERLSIYEKSKFRSDEIKQLVREIIEEKGEAAANPGTDVVTDDYNLRIAKKIDTLSEDGDETMQPSTANLEGAHNGYFFIPINGEKYRYKVASDQRNQGSVDSLIYECSSDTTFEAEGTYEIYSLKEYPDYRFLQCKGNTNDMVLLEYSPSRKNTEFALEDVEKDGFVVLKNGNVCYGEDIWDEFVKRTELGLFASVWICQCYENAGNSAPGLYEAKKEDYPSMYLSQLYYDGTAYTISPMHKVEDEYMIYEKKGVDRPEETFRYMLHFVEEGNTRNVTFKSFDKYVLTNKEDVTWQQLSKSILSGGSDYIRFVEVFTKYEWKED